MKVKKSLGQNFFVNANLRKYILERLEISSAQSIVEIGPGLGFFTEKLVEMFKDVTVIEKDRELARNLKLRFPNISVIEADFLDINLDTLKKKNLYFGSLPYNVSKAIIRKVVQHKSFSEKALFIVQKEVGEKYIYKEPYNILSLTTHIYANTKKEFDIAPDSFRPKPKVTSSLISLTPNKIEDIQIEKLEELIKLSFRQPRKNLRNNLKNTEYFDKSVKYLNLRPAQLSLDTYISILKS